MPKITQSFSSAAASPGAASDDDDDAGSWTGPMSQTDNRTPAGKRRRSGLPCAARPVAPIRPTKTIHDRVYGAVSTPGLLVAAMDTAEFQRLDRIQQLGGSSFVFPSATHTRKEHSIGTSHLAGLVVRHLREAQPSLNIDDADVLCVQLAALLHDCGHGPYSHMWETVCQTWHGRDFPGHEDMSLRLVAVIAKKIPIAAYLGRTSAAAAQKDVAFVQACIEGYPDAKPWDEARLGRPESKRFLLDIVSNSRSGIDVDKLDYLMRDSVSTLGTAASSFDPRRLFAACRVVRPGPRAPGQIAFEEKVALDINRIFKLRSEMHQMVYQHRVGTVAEAMVTDILLAAEDSEMRVFAQSEDGEYQSFRLSEAARDAGAFTQLTDGLLDAIGTSADAGPKARGLLARLRRRDMYALVGKGVTLRTLPLCVRCGAETEPTDRFCAKCGASCRGRDRTETKPGVYVPLNLKLRKEDCARAIWERVEPKGFVKEDEILVHLTNITYGWKTRVPDRGDSDEIHWEVRDPLANVLFFNPKDERDRGYRVGTDHVSGLFLPRATQERVLYCYFKGDPADDAKLRALAEAYESYARTLPGTACVGKMNPTPSPMARRRGVDSDGSAPPLPAMGDGSPVGGRTLDMDALRSGADADSDADSDAADDGRRVHARLTQI